MSKIAYMHLMQINSLGDEMKVVCSIGPNVKSLSDLDKFIDAGMDSARLNFSHIEYEKAKDQIKYIKDKYPSITIIQDLQGNKLRVSSLFNGQLRVNFGESVYFCSEDFYKSNLRHSDKHILIPISFQGEFSWLTNANKILMKDGTMEFKITGKLKDKDAIKAEVVIGGMVRGEKGLNAPGMDRTGMSLTVKDKSDIEFGIQNKVDVICLSYVTRAADILDLKAYIGEIKKDKTDINIPKLWAKIECKEGIDSFDEIVNEVDGIMLGRGDLLSELDIVEIPFVQDKIIEKMKSSKKELIIATYVLDSMRNSFKPKIPEADDIYNFLKNKVDAVMLAGEVGVGRNPIEVIKFAKKIIDKYSYYD
ncbi:MAG: pyruvate kinase [Clostridium sp.]|uniref:pyruvate kinase n=1 Tax=Clostridium sp. TaxID=1506 RepID=UPI0030759B91